MAKICINSNSSENRRCQNCKHYKYDVEYGSFSCYAEPNESQEVQWEEKEQDDKHV